AAPGAPAPATPPPAKPVEEEDDPFAEATKPEPSPSARPVGIPVSQGQGGPVTAEAAGKNSRGGPDKTPDPTKKAEQSRSPVAPTDENPFKEE
ncbi:MAG: hypothetical protein GX621_03575, partial [Pirellulaceae bacterium]|nr:hypothetical protein [Pirellulaceae bacterium]